MRVHSSEILSDESFELAALSHFSTNTLKGTFDNGGQGILIKNKLTLELSANLGLFDFIELGISLPFVLNQSQDPLLSHNISKVTYLSDIRLGGKIALPFQHLFGPFGLALATTLTLPSGNPNAFQGRGVLVVSPRLILDLQVSDHATLAFNLSSQHYQARRFGNHIDSGSLKTSLGAELFLSDQFSFLTTYELSFPHSQNQNGDRPSASELDAIFRYTLPTWGGSQSGYSLGFDLGGGLGIASSPGIPDYRIIAGLHISTSVSEDRDGDHILDDKCPSLPEDFDGFQDEDGCPEKDNDADGCFDSQDRCPMLAEDYDGFQDEDGCPDLDNDNDGINDSLDDCPDERGVIENAGCPLHQ